LRRLERVDVEGACGMVRADGSANYPLVLQAIALASRDEYLKQAIGGAGELNVHRWGAGSSQQQSLVRLGLRVDGGRRIV
jgi:hypothetical protein